MNRKLRNIGSAASVGPALILDFVSMSRESTIRGNPREADLATLKIIPFSLRGVGTVDASKQEADYIEQPFYISLVFWGIFVTLVAATAIQRLFGKD
jgi:hypothetical protein